MKIPFRYGYGFTLLAVTAFAMLVLSCGNGDIAGAAGGWGEDKTNTSVYMELHPASVDLDICNDVSIGLVANINTEQVNPSLPPNTLYLEGYEVDFEPDEPGSPHVRGSKYKLSSVLPASDLGMFFIDPGIKAAFLNDINSGQYDGMHGFPSYSARYTAYGTDAFNGTPRVWGSRASFSFKMGRYSICVPSIVPMDITVRALINPDNNFPEPDDITFTIAGGTAPYTVISNSPLIESPGDLGTGNMIFTVDPEKPVSTTTVTLTVTDSANQKTVASVTLNP
jgi:hypothetical protein